MTVPVTESWTIAEENGFEEIATLEGTELRNAYYYDKDVALGVRSNAEGERGSELEALHEEMIPHQQRGEHGFRWDAHGLHQEEAQRQGQQRGDGHDLEAIPEGTRQRRRSVRDPSRLRCGSLAGSGGPPLGSLETSASRRPSPSLRPTSRCSHIPRVPARPGSSLGVESDLGWGGAWETR